MRSRAADANGQEGVGQEPRQRMVELRDPAEFEARRVRAEQAEYIANKLHAILWVIGGAVAAYYSKIYDVIVVDQAAQLDKPWFYFGAACFGMSFGIMLYLVFWVRYVERNTMDWRVYRPNVVFAGGVSGFAAAVGFTVGLWPVYGFLTVPLEAALFFGAVFLLSFLPL